MMKATKGEGEANFLWVLELKMLLLKSLDMLNSMPEIKTHKKQLLFYRTGKKIIKNDCFSWQESPTGAIVVSILWS